MKKFLLAMIVGLMTGFAYADLRSTDNLRHYGVNLDILADKSNNLPQLIEELQGFAVIRATCAGGGSNIVDSTVNEGDTVVSAIVLSSANITLSTAGTTVGASQDGSESGLITLRSKIAGTFGNNLKIVFTQMTSSGIYGGALTVVTTGYSTEVKLSSAGIFNYTASTRSASFATGARVCSAIQAYAPANDLMTCEVVNSTRQVLASPQISFVGGLGNVLQPNVISGDHFTVYDGRIAIASDAPVDKSDTLILYIFRRPQE